MLHVVTRLNAGGVTHQILTVTEQLRKLGYDVQIAAGRCGRREVDCSRDIIERGVQVCKLSHLSNAAGPVGDLLAFLELYRLFRNTRPSLVHLHMFKARVLGSLAAWLAGIPVIIETLHGNILEGYYNKLATAIILFAERIVGWMLAQCVIAVSEGPRAELIRYGVAPARKIKVVRYGFDFDRLLNLAPFRGQLKAELNIPSGVVVVGIVSRLVPIKGLDDFLKAADHVVKSNGKIPIHVVIAGDGELREELEGYCKGVGIERVCRFLGWRDDIEKIYADIDVFVMSSLNEGSPVSLIEAMAAGKAIVSTGVGGIPDMLEDGVSAFLVPPKEPQALAAAILRLVSEGDTRERLGKEAQVRALQDYSIPSLVCQIEGLYQALLSSHGIKAGQR